VIDGEGATGWGGLVGSDIDSPGLNHLARQAEVSRAMRSTIKNTVNNLIFILNVFFFQGKIYHNLKNTERGGYTFT
jgi:hypothetical protein